MSEKVEISRLLTSDEVAAVLQVSTSTLSRWRHRGEGPAWHALAGGFPRYSVADVKVWLTTQRREAA